MTIEKDIHKNHRNRMYNSFLSGGFSSFSEIQKLEYLLFFAIPRKDVNPLAHKLIGEFGSIDKVLAASYEDLLKVDGVGKHTALFLCTINEVRNEIHAGNNTLTLNGSKESCEYCYKLLRHSQVEEFYVICLTASNKIIKTIKLATGSAHKVDVSIREIMKLAFKHQASKIIIAHNHPSGKLVFSDEDLNLTLNIISSCVLNDIMFLDHVLVTATQTMSLVEARYIDAMLNIVCDRLNIRKKFTTKTSEPYQDFKIDYKTQDEPDLSKIKFNQID